MDPQEAGAARAAALAASSRSLGELLDRDLDLAATLAEPGLIGDRAGYLQALRAAGADEGMAGVRRAKRALLARIAAADLTGEAALEEVTAALADLADAALEITLEHLDAPGGLAIIAMGKLGARELNYVSDIDVVFVADGDFEAATKAAEAVLHALGEVSPEGQAYEIDASLRPEGKAGALVRSLDGYIEYYTRWAEPWEHQALLKARHAAGNADLGSRFVEATRRFVFPEQIDADRIASIRKMKQRVEDQAARSARRSRSTDMDDVKLGPGGIRDIEFSVQLLQLVHGGADPSVRLRATLDALPALVDGGYVAEEDGAGLGVAYRWLRNVEHRLQLWQERRVRRLPQDDERRAQLARSLGFRDTPNESAADRFEQRHSAVLADVRGRFEKLFYRPMVEALADSGAQRMSPEALRERLRVLGFRDVDRAVRTLEGLVSGTSRRAKLFRVLTPAMLRFLASTPQPDEGLFAFLRIGEGIAPEGLGALRDNPPGLELLARVLGSGRLLGEVLRHVPEELQTIAEPDGLGPPKDREHLVREAVASLGWREPEQRLDGLRRFKRRAMLHVALADVADTADVEAVGAGLADLADACLVAALGEPGFPFAVIAMGKLGGRELNYSSDIDVMFVHEGPQSEAESLAESLMSAIGEVTPEGQAFRIDAGLRPEGKAGLLARALSSFEDYYKRWAQPWEHQALLKARVAAGDEELGQRLIDVTRVHAWPQELSAEALAEVRHLKARMERERVPRGIDPRRHIKMGPGGLADVEFAVQILQRRHASSVEPLRVRGTIEALHAARGADLLSDEDARHLEESYVFLMRLRNRLFFIAGKPVDALPSKPEDLEALGIATGFVDQPRQELEESYLRVTRRARKVAEELIYGGVNR